MVASVGWPLRCALARDCARRGAAPVRLSRFTLRNAADAMARAFENGVVLGNPSMHEYTFDLAALFPGMRLRRFQGYPEQDAVTNNGEAVRIRVTLGARDGLFLVRQSDSSNSGER